MATDSAPAPRPRQLPPERLMLAASLLAVVGLALPWRNSHLGSGFASTWLPGTCQVTHDGSSYCDLGSIGYGTTTTVLGPVPGLAGPARVILPLAAVLVLVGRRTGSIAASRLGLDVAVATLSSAALPSPRVGWSPSPPSCCAPARWVGESATCFSDPRRGTPSHC